MHTCKDFRPVRFIVIESPKVCCSFLPSTAGHLTSLKHVMVHRNLANPVHHSVPKTLFWTNVNGGKHGPAQTRAKWHSTLTWDSPHPPNPAVVQRSLKPPSQKKRKCKSADLLPPSLAPPPLPSGISKHSQRAARPNMEHGTNATPRTQTKVAPPGDQPRDRTSTQQP